MKKIILVLVLLINSIASNSQTVLVKYDFNGSTAADLSGNGYNGTLNGTTNYVTDRFGSPNSALFFNGFGDYLNTNGCQGVMGSDDRTISFWAKVEPADTGGYVFDYGNDAIGGDFHYELKNSGYEGMMVDISDEVKAYGANINDGIWHNYAVTFTTSQGTGMNGISFYRDGNLYSNIIYTYNPGGHNVFTGFIGELLLGRGTFSLDDFQMLNVAKTPTQVDSMYLSEMPLSSSLLAGYNFNGNVDDYTGNGNNGSSILVTQTNDRFGNANKAYHFNGSAYINCGIGMPIGNSDFSLSFWARRDSINSVTQTVVSKGVAATNQGLEAGFFFTGNHQFIIDQYGNNTNNTTGADSPDWQHWFCTKDNTTQMMTIYLNGQFIQTTNVATPFSGSGNFYIGSAAWGGNEFYGDIDEVKVFNATLTQPQIDSIYQIERTPQCVITVGGSQNNVTCYGFNDGSASCAGTSGTPPYTYYWTIGGVTTPNINSLIPGSNTCTVTDALGCIGEYVVNITEPAQINFDSFSSTDETCSGMCNGTGSVSASGGAGGITYAWFPGSFLVANPTGLCPGTYTCYAQDVNSCFTTTTTVVASAVPLTMSPTFSNSTCFSANDGYILSNPTGGTAPYSVLWTASSYTVAATDIYNLAAGTYTCDVTDFYGCVATYTVAITEPSQINVMFLPTNSTCGLSDGSLNTSVSGGLAPYTYLWGDATVNPSLTNIPAGQYYLTVADANGCMNNTVGDVDDASAPVITLDGITPVSCAGMNDGAILTTISGGTPPLDIVWLTGELTDDLSGLYSGTYELSVTDATGCLTYRTYYVSEPNYMYINTTENSPTACTLIDGSSFATELGGTSPYTYQWDANTGNQTGQNATSLGAGVYQVRVTDANGCKDSTFVSIVDPGSPTITIDSVFQAGCVNAQNTGSGEIHISVTGGSGLYSYLWSTAATTEDVTGLGKGFHGVIVTDIVTTCKTSEAQYIYGIQPGTPQICLATVDTATNHNIIIWEKNTPGISNYKIYREASTGAGFNLIATIPADSLSQFEDTLANPDLRPWKYELAVEDSCGGRSTFSVFHKPVYVMAVADAGIGVDLTWDDYIGFPYSKYFIFRNHHSTGWMLIDSTLLGTNVYNDPTPPQPIDTLEYMIEVYPNTPCNSTRGVINTTRSNIKTPSSKITTGIKSTDDLNTSWIIYPNPSNGLFNLGFENPLEKTARISIKNNLGQQVYSDSHLEGKQTQQIDLNTLPAGIYFVQLSNGNKSGIKRIVIMK